MKKGLLSALCLAVLLSAPACCWRKCGPCKPVCDRVCSPCQEECVDVEEHYEPVTAERLVTTKTIRKCGEVHVETPCCPEEGAKPMMKKHRKNSDM